MALQAAAFPQDLFGYYTCKDNYPVEGAWSWMEDTGATRQEQSLGGANWDSHQFGANSSMDALTGITTATEAEAAVNAGAGCAKRRRRLTKGAKNEEEAEHQRRVHIAVERNRRKQMNQYLAALRALMPPSYAQKGDQASIVGGAINYVKELEQLLQSLEAQKKPTTRPFAGFFAFPQYLASERAMAVADIGVMAVEGHANLKVLAARQPKQLLRMVVGLQNLRLAPLHLNVTSTAGGDMVLYCFSLKVEDDCQYTAADEIAAAVYQMMGRIQRDQSHF